MRARILHLTDLHLFEDPAQLLRGVPSDACVSQVFEHLGDQVDQADLIVITGDLAHDERDATYRRLIETFLRGLLDRVLVIPGNHDDRSSLRSHFPKQFESLQIADDWIVFSQALAGWRLLGLDTHVPGEIHGEVDDRQYDWLQSELERHRDSPTLLFLHHHPVSIACAWLDRLALRNPERLESILSVHDQVRLVVGGHIHQVFETEFGGRNFVTTPSASMQFAPHCDTPRYDAIPPGYRWIDLKDDGTCESRVVRVEELRFPPDLFGRE